MTHGNEVLRHDAENAQSMLLCCTLLCQREDVAVQVLSPRRQAGAGHDSIMTPQTSLARPLACIWAWTMWRSSSALGMILGDHSKTQLGCQGIQAAMCSQQRQAKLAPLPRTHAGSPPVGRPWRAGSRLPHSCMLVGDPLVTIACASFELQGRRRRVRRTGPYSSGLM